MREQHPLDDLFARTLRDAEAAPSDAVWEGIVQERGWAHLTLLRLRRRWVWLALLLLLGGTAGYVGITSSGEKHAGVRYFHYGGERLLGWIRTGDSGAFKLSGRSRTNTCFIHDRLAANG